MANELVTKYANKASGYYREIIDASQQPDVINSNNVVVVLQSEQGAIMKPVYVKDATQLHALFGNRNAKLEQKGCYGILMAEHVLNTGPIWVMNIKNIDAANETVQSRQLACANGDTDKLVDIALNKVYDTTKFWNIDETFGTYGDGALFSLTSVNNGTVTAIVRKYSDDSNDYNYTIAKTKEMNPDFLGMGLDDNKLVSDYLIEVHLFKGNLLNAKLSVSNAFLGKSINLAKLEAIEADAASGYYATYRGSVGDVIDIEGTNLNICTAINADTTSTGLYAAVNMDKLLDNGIDLIGEGALKFSDTADALPTVEQISRIGYSFTPETFEQTINVVQGDETTAFCIDPSNIKVGTVIADAKQSARVLAIDYVDNYYDLGSKTPGTIDAPVMPDGQPFPKNANGIAVYPPESPKAGQPLEYSSSDDNKVYNYTYEQVATNGDWSAEILQGTLPADNVAKALKVQYMLNGQAYEVSGDILIPELTETEQIATAVTDTLNAILANVLAGLSINATCEFAVDRYNVSITTSAVPTTCYNFSIKKLTVATVDSIVTETTAASNIQSEKKELVELPEDYDKDALSELYGTQQKIYKLTLSEPLRNFADTEDTKVMRVAGVDYDVTPSTALIMKPWWSGMTMASPNVITGIVSLEKHYVNGTAARQNTILDMLNTEGIMNSFMDATIFRCRYMVDTFKTYIEPSAKYQYGKLANNANRFLVFIPSPFYHELRASKNPDFYDLLGKFQMTYVAAGKNPDKPSTNTFSYDNGAETGRFLVPCMNVKYNDGFSSTVVPSTGAIGALFYSKLTGTRKVYDIVAGSAWPIVASGVTDGEFNPASTERAAMESIGTNVIQKLDGVLQLRSNRTAYQSVRSAMNHPETLEKVFYVNDAVEPTMNAQQFKYNNNDSRLAVKSAADAACDQLVSDGAIASYENICDTSNNTAEVRAAGIIVLDTTLYNNYGIIIAVHRTTVKMAE